MANSPTVDRVFREIDAKLRKAALAEIGGFRPPATPLSSWFGGGFVHPKGAAWPENENGPMLPLLQVYVPELPIILPALTGTKLLQVFIDQRELPLDMPAKAGEKWAIRSYEDVENVEQVSVPESARQLGTFPIKWKLVEADCPGWEDAFENVPHHNEFMRGPESINLFYDRYSQQSGTKVGGWPTWIQGAMSTPGDFVLQIASEEKPRWMVGDNGNLYIFKDTETWWLVWDCY